MQYRVSIDAVLFVAETAVGETKSILRNLIIFPLFRIVHNEQTVTK